MTEIEFKKYLWDAANKLRGSVDAAEYKYPVLGLVFLKYVSDMFAAQTDRIWAQITDPESDLHMPPDMQVKAFDDMAEDPDSYTKDNVFWVPPESRFDKLLAGAAEPGLAQRLDDAVAAIERENEPLRGVLYRDFGRLPLENGRLAELMQIIAKMGFDQGQHAARDVFGEVYEYLLGQFALSEGQKAGQFYTARSVVQTLVEVLAPYKGRIYDPCCGSGGMFVYSEKFIEAHGGKRGQSSIYGQELGATTRKLACMNLAIRGLEYDLGKRYGDTFHNDQHPDLRADYILANPQFNDSDWGGDKLEGDPRWVYGVPPNNNANFAWLQHMAARLAKNGRAGVVLANGSMTSNNGGEGQIREAMVRDDLVECMVALPGQLFANTQIPVCLWFLSRDKSAGTGGTHDRRGQVLFIDARHMAELIPGSRKQKQLSDAEIQRIAQTYHAWRGTQWAEDEYDDEAGFCKSADLAEIERHGFALTPGRYVGIEEAEDDDEAFEAKMDELTGELSTLLNRGNELESEVREQLARVGYDV
ncbi:class I SAM-dependent DNA methyltransferase [Salinisphaera orenii]|uniref:class I SAM-dependent DNA methyltransferase n=1 Tax=Salinisphaera orenii TaxID=856731 RepID=UPI000DBE6432